MSHNHYLHARCTVITVHTCVAGTLSTCENASHNHYLHARCTVLYCAYLSGGSQDSRTRQSRLSRTASKSVVSVRGSTSIDDTASCVTLWLHSSSETKQGITRSGETICPSHRWWQISGRIHVHPWTGLQSAHLC